MKGEGDYAVHADAESYQPSLEGDLQKTVLLLKLNLVVSRPMASLFLMGHSLPLLVRLQSKVSSLTNLLLFNLPPSIQISRSHSGLAAQLPIPHNSAAGAGWQDFPEEAQYDGPERWLGGCFTAIIHLKVN